MVVVGGTGSGRSRLAQEVRRRFSERPVWAARGLPDADAVPLGAIAHWLDRPPPTAEPGAGSTNEAGLEPGAVLRFLRGLATDVAPVIVVDDVHRLDRATAVLLGHLLEGTGSSVLVTVDESSPLPTALGDELGPGRARRIDLTPLDRQEVAVAATEELGGAVSPATLDRLVDLSAGVPVLLAALLGRGPGDGAVSKRLGLWTWDRSPLDDDPTSPDARSSDLAAWRELVGRFVPDLDDRAESILDIVAVARPIRLEALERFASLDELARLEDLGVIVAAGEPPVVDLRIPLVGAARLAAAGPTRRRWLEHQALELVGSIGDMTADERHQVARWSVALGQHRPAAELVDAARTARLAGDTTTAATLLRAALDDEPTAATRLDLAELYEVTGRADAALEVLDHPRGEDPATPSPELRGVDDEVGARTASCRMRVLALGLGRPDEAEAVATATLLGPAGAAMDPAWRDYVEAQWATILTMGGRIEPAAEMAARLFASDDPRIRLRSLPAVHLVAFCQGRFADGAAAAKEMAPLALAHRSVLPQAASWVASSWAFHLLGLGRLDELAFLLGLIDDDPSSSIPTYRAFRSMIAARLDLARGAAGEALDHAVESTDLFRSGADEQGFLPASLGLLVEAAVLAGRSGLATEAARAAEAALASTAFRLHHLDVRRGVAWAAMADGDTRRAAAALVAAADDCRDASCLALEAVALHDAVRCGAGRTVQRRLLSVTRRMQGPLVATWAAHARALLDHRASGLEEVAAAFEGLGFRLLAAEAYATAARQHRADGVGTAAIRCGSRADALVAGTAAPVLVELPADVPTLTARERQVARLAASGRSSRAIAEHLAISRRTVDNQLGSVYRKLGVTGRDGLRALLGDAPD